METVAFSIGLVLLRGGNLFLLIFNWNKVLLARTACRIDIAPDVCKKFNYRLSEIRKFPFSINLPNRAAPRSLILFSDKFNFIRFPRDANEASGTPYVNCSMCAVISLHLDKVSSYSDSEHLCIMSFRQRSVGPLI